MPPSTLTVFGASGGIGRRLVEQGLAAGHRMVAVVRDPARLPVRHDRLEVRVGDLWRPDTIGTAVQGADAVLSALGQRRGEPETIMSEGIVAIQEAMKAAGVRRIVAVSAAPMLPARPGDPFVYRMAARSLAWRFFGGHYRQLRLMEDSLERSGLDWSTVHPARLTDKPATGRPRYAVDGPAGRLLTISRADVAAVMLRVVEDESTIGRHVTFE